MQQNVRRVLVVEDDYLQAQDISHFVRGTGGHVLGPVPSLQRGFDFADKADAAVLDIDLSGQKVFPLADLLMSRNVPIVFYSGLPAEVNLPRRFWRVPIVRKPVVNLSDAAIITMSNFSGGSEDDLLVILPKLRLAARLIYNDPVVADRLVERLLEDAIAYLKSGGDMSGGDVKVRWLMDRLRRIVSDGGRDLLN
ncbi:MULTISPECIES: response regulator [Actibacterium]|uniref:CheY-like chemotaxis protein n=1 Tax=Actibacterium naphthalenivorans TaxID=1614693 RepID=A0A840C5K1_9RHOB|nr:MULTISPECIES: response regulator [Actibacterium]MBB4021211.1 CheY-like chemotaxis protein [Actibacterium naphthalenivorans]